VYFNENDFIYTLQSVYSVKYTRLDSYLLRILNDE